MPLSVLDTESKETDSTSFKTIKTYSDIINIAISTITSALVLYGIYKIKPKALLPALVVTVSFIFDIKKWGDASWRHKIFASWWHRFMSPTGNWRNCQLVT